MVNTFNWKTNSNIVEFTSVFTVKNAVDTRTRQCLVSEILYHKSKTADDSGSEKNCWRGHVQFNNDYVYDLILTVYGLYLNSLPLPAPLSKNSKPKDIFATNDPLIHYWANVNSTGGYNISHTHAGSLLSGVIYLQATDTGMIEFTPLNYIYKINHPCWMYDGAMQYFPEDGDVLIFPSYLLHRVEPNPNNKERINLAFNIAYQTK